MEYGMPSLICFTTLEQHAAFCRENGYRFVELNMTYPWFQAENIPAVALKALGKEYGIGFTLHLHDQLNPMELCAEMRKASLRVVMQATELALQSGLPRITMHLMPGTYSTVNGTRVYLYERCKADYLALADQFRDAVTSKLAGSGTAFCIENTAGYLPYQREAVERLLLSPCFGLTYDIGHDAKTGFRDRDFVLSHAERLRHFHIHDCDAKANHLALGGGTLEIRPALELAQRLGASLVIEVKEAGSLAVSRDYLSRIGMWE